MSLEVMRYDSLISTGDDHGIACCAPYLMRAQPGFALVHVSAVIDVPWSEDLDRVSATSGKLTMTVPGGEPVGPIGDFDRRGLFEVAGGGVSASRPRDWPESDEHLVMEQVWMLPEDATTATLAIDEAFAAEIDLPQVVSDPISPGDTAAFVITGFSRVDSLEFEQSANRQKIPGSLVPSAGQIVKVDFDITPLMHSNIGGNDGYLLYTRYLQLVGPSGLPTAPLGQYLSDSMTTNTTNSFSGNSYLGSTYDKTFYYLTDGSAGTYTLYFLGDPVAEAVLE
ncbi:MAG: hypothetical protein ACFCVH_19660 [Alphaproteobacteria bacterium]